MFPQFADTTAGDRAGEARLVGRQPRVSDGVPIEVLGFLELPLLEVAGRQSAKGLGQVDRRGGPEHAEGLVGRVDDHLAPHVPQRLHESVAVGEFNATGATHRDRLEPLGSHHRAHSAASGGTVFVVHDAGELHQILTGRTNAAGPQAGDAQFLSQSVLGVTHGLAPQVRGVSQFNAVVVDEQVFGCLGRALDQHHVIAGELQLRTPEPSRVGRGDAVGQRPLGDHHVPRPTRSTGARQRTGGKDQDVVRGKWIDGGIHFLEEVPVGEPAAANVVLHPLLGNVLGRRRAGRHVDSQQLASPTTHRLLSAGENARRRRGNLNP